MRLLMYLCLCCFVCCFSTYSVEAQVPRLGISTQKKQTKIPQLNYAEIDEYELLAHELSKQKLLLYLQLLFGL